MIVNKSFSYNKYERLNSSLFKKTLLTGKSIYIKPYKLYWLCIDNRSGTFYPARLAVVVGKKIVPKAAHRNRIKRLIKEAYRLNKPFLYNTISVRLPGKQFFFIINFINKNISDYRLVKFNFIKLGLERLINHFIILLGQ